MIPSPFVVCYAPLHIDLPIILEQRGNIHCKLVDIKWSQYGMFAFMENV